MMQGSLITDTNNYAKCVIINRAIESDGQGGYVTVWTEGAEFGAAIAVEQSSEARVAASLGVRDVYSVYTDTALVMTYNTVFRRIKDGKVFRVTSDGDDKQTPTSSPLNMRKVTAEEWKIPTA
jgi:hypothetical protein